MDVASQTSVLDVLKAKAMLLLRREREVFELRKDRSRTETWLQAFHKLALDLKARTSAALFEDWVSVMVGELAFQVAAVYRVEGSDGKLKLLFDRGHVPRPAEVTIDAACLEYMLASRNGAYETGRQPALESLSDTVGIAKFVWGVLETRGSQLILLAGFSPESSQFYVLREQDLAHFTLLSAYLMATLDNAALIAELDGERSELRQSNHQLDKSLQQLRETQARLVESSRIVAEVSRHAGMADVATGVLHNVGNALNSVNVSAELIMERLRALRVTGVGRLAELLNRPPAILVEYLLEDDHVHEIACYLQKLGAHLSGERNEIVSEVEALKRHIDHIKIIVSKQQAYATTVGLTQPCVPAQLVDDSISMLQDSLEREAIEIVRDYEPVPDLLLDRHKVLQILVNLLSNAKHALSASGRSGDRRISVRLRQAEPSRFHIYVDDNGVGIPHECLDMIFSYGFTTKKNGHGFGLHASALAAKEMGGRLSCKSEGCGRGATFKLDLPMRFVKPAEV